MEKRTEPALSGEMVTFFYYLKPYPFHSLINPLHHRCWGALWSGKRKHDDDEPGQWSPSFLVSEINILQQQLQTRCAVSIFFWGRRTTFTARFESAHPFVWVLSLYWDIIIIFCHTRNFPSSSFLGFVVVMPKTLHFYVTNKFMFRRLKEKCGKQKKIIIYFSPFFPDMCTMMMKLRMVMILWDMMRVYPDRSQLLLEILYANSCCQDIKFLIPSVRISPLLRVCVCAVHFRETYQN